MPGGQKTAADVPVVINMGGTKIELHQHELARVVDKLNETARVFNYQLQFRVSHGNRVMVKVIDSASGQIVREIPPGGVMEAFSRMQDVMGVLFDQRV